ncbi:MAG TPA: response regulator transcription factor [Candidatus Dormibacteraeota bacterium]|nr:response regulator transcription factor [Candidatus Dormibacteraeota bacterium]
MWTNLGREGLIRVGIVDDHPVFRFGLRRSLEREPDVEVVWETARASEAMRRVPTGSVDIVLMDLDLGPDEDALAATRLIRERHRQVRVIVLSAALEWEAAAAARTAGATGYIGKDIAISDMVASIRRLAAHPEAVEETDFRRPGRGHGASWAETQGLSRREREVLEELCRGHSNREIASRLHVSTTTVNKHVQHVFKKLRVRTRAQAVAHALAAQRTPHQDGRNSSPDPSRGVA